MTWLYLNDTVLQKRNTFFVINSTAEIRQDTLSYTLTYISSDFVFEFSVFYKKRQGCCSLSDFNSVLLFCRKMACIYVIPFLRNMYIFLLDVPFSIYWTNFCFGFADK